MSAATNLTRHLQADQEVSVAEAKAQLGGRLVV
jgi:hypothetical protein